MSLDITSYDPNQLKQSLIEFYQNRPGFEDFNYEGSAINTIIDNLVRNTHYIAYMANMVASESFLDSAQLRANIVSHAQKLSYTPRSRTAASMVVNIEVTPSAVPSESSIVCDKGSSFINTIDGTSYNFVNVEDITLTIQAGKFIANNINLKQGLLNSQKFLYAGDKIEIKNPDIDTSTLRVYVRETQAALTRKEYVKVENITDASNKDFLFYLSENTRGYYDIEFGKGVLGVEPPNGAVIEIEYVVVEEFHANGLSAIIAASSIGGYSNIKLTATTPAYGGAERSSLEMIKFMAPRIYQTQERAVKENDYEVLARRDFPYVKSVIAWGGERNDPPYYGRVFLSAIPQTGYVIADSVKDVMSNHMRKYSLMSTHVIDPEYIFVDLDVKIMYDKNKTTLTFDQVKTQVTQTINTFASDIKEFNGWFNNTALEQKIVNAVTPVYSVESSKSVYKWISPRVNTTSAYSVKFVNKIVPGSVKIDDVYVSILAAKQSLTDDGLGKLVLDVDGVKTVVGSVDYEKGNIDFLYTQLSNPNIADLKVHVTVASENILTSRNFVVSIEKVVINKVDKND
jgi:hypothetical protein